MSRLSRDRSDFSDFVVARSPALQRAAYLMVGDVGLAQDLVQEALVKTYAAWTRLADLGHAEAYARTSVTTTAISWFRRKSYSNERTVQRLPDPMITDHAGAVVDHSAVWGALLTLPVRQRTAVVLRYYEDLTEAQTAETMGCAVGTVKSQVSAAMAKLRELLGDDPDLLPALDTLAVTR